MPAISFNVLVPPTKRPIGSYPPDDAPHARTIGCSKLCGVSSMGTSYNLIA